VEVGFPQYRRDNFASQAFVAPEKGSQRSEDIRERKMPRCAMCGREIGKYEQHKKDKKGAAYCSDCRGPHFKPGPPKDSRRPGKPSPRKVSFEHGKKPELKRLGAGWRCPDCGEWITGPEHRCSGHRYTTFTEKNRYVTPPSRSRGRPSRSSSEAQYLREKEEKEGGRPAPVPPMRRKPLSEEEKKAGKKILKAHRAARGRGKLRAAIETGKAIRGIGYDVDPDRGFLPAAERKEAKGSDAYKHLEPDYVWEAIDPEHRFGYFLKIKYKKWLADSKKLRGMSFWEYIDQPDIRAEWKGNIVRYVKKKNLPQYRISPKLSGGQLRLYRGQPGEPFDTRDKKILWNGVQHGWAIYVQDPATSVIYSASAVASDERVEMAEMAEEKRLESEKQRSVFHHSSFLGGKPVLCAGEWIVIAGQIICVSPMTGHYKIKLPQFMNFLEYLEKILKADLRDITVKWPWPQVDPPAHPDPHYYNANTFLHRATELEFMCEPYGRDGPLPETDRDNNPLEQDPRSGALQYAPSRIRQLSLSADKKECPRCGYTNCVC
jgi:hypothetical protein